MKAHDMKTLVINCQAINYFYKREKNDINGNPRFRVYIMDHDAPVVYMIICAANNKNGSCYLSFCMDHHTLETWFETSIAVYTRDDGEKIINGFYKKYEHKTLKAAKNKFDALTQKHNIN